MTVRSDIRFISNRKMLQKGASEPWPQQLEELTGSKDMDVKPLLDYFRPLEAFLDKELAGNKLGWNYDGELQDGNQ